MRCAFIVAVMYLLFMGVIAVWAGNELNPKPVVLDVSVLDISKYPTGKK